VSCRPYVPPDPANSPVWVDQEGASDGSFQQTAHESLGSPDSILSHYGAVRVCYQHERQLLSGGKAGMGFDGIRADSHDHRFFLLEGGVGISKLARFASATGGVVPRVEVEYDPAATAVLEPEKAALGVRGLEHWRLCALLQIDGFLFHGCGEVGPGFGSARVLTGHAGLGLGRACCPGMGPLLGLALNWRTPSQI